MPCAIGTRFGETYSRQLEHSASKELLELSKQDRERVVAAIDSLPLGLRRSGVFVLQPARPDPSIRALWTRAFTLARPLEFRGVTRYENIERAFAARTRATLQRMRGTRQ